MPSLQNIGPVEKLRMTPFKSGTFDEEVKNPSEFTVIANPEKYTIGYNVKYNTDQALGDSHNNPKFVNTESPDLNFDFVFDGTGVLEHGVANKSSVIDQIEDFKKVVFEYEGDIHKPYHVRIAWGSLIFHGILVSMSIEFKLFKPSGEPLRAVVKTSFKGSVDDDLRAALNKNNSPDLTHVRIVREGDTLPIMTERIYGDSKYYLEVARVNNLINFRNLKAGQEIFFPPIEKTS